MFQTKILVTFPSYGPTPLTTEGLAKIEILKAEGKTDGILILDPPLNFDELPTQYWIKEEYAPDTFGSDHARFKFFKPYQERHGLRTWIDRAAAEEYVSWWNGKCTEHGYETPTYEIIEIV
jgi:hypothetical protein